MSDDSYYIKPRRVRTRLGAGGVVARLDPDADNVLIALIRNRPDQAYVLPKGGVDRGETLEGAARREIEEEAGFIRLHCLGELGLGERLNNRRTRWQTTHYFLFITDQKTARPTEHTDWEVAWFPIDRLPEMYWREQRKLIEDNRERIVRLIKHSPGT
jgi:8-oxo-dGTP pyrophosphatase MutT (NUDIX family)